MDANLPKHAWVCGAVLLLGLGCQEAPVVPPNTYVPETVRIGVLPGEAPEQLEAKFAPLIAHLDAAIDTQCEFRMTESYDELVDLFGAGQFDLARFGALTFVQAETRHGAVPLVMRDVDLKFTTYFLARASDTAQTLEDFAGRRFAFGSTLSTSGHLMPRYFLGTRHIEPEAFFSEVQFSGAHDRTAEWVRDGDVDLGAANAAIIRQMYESGTLSRDEVRVLWETPPYADYVWAVPQTLDPTVRNQLRDAFLALMPDHPEHAAILQSLSAHHFLPARSEEFTNLAAIARDAGLLDGNS